MYNLAKLGYTNDEILRMLKQNRTITYRYELLDKEDRTIGTVSASGSIDFNSEAAIKRAASISIKEVGDINFLTDRIKPFMCLHTPNGIAEFPLGVFLLSSPSRRSITGAIGRDIDCYDKTQILADDKFTSRYYIAAGTNYISAVNGILQDAGIQNAQLAVTTLETAVDMEFEVGTDRLTAINKLLKAINYTDLYVDATGIFRASTYVDPQIRKIEMSYSTDKASITLPGAEEELDMFNAPNKIVRYLENAERDILISVAENNDPTSKLSIPSRGRVIVDVEAVSDIADQSTLDAYVQRVAAEKKIYQYINFETAAMPMHEYLDCYYIDNKDLGVSGKYIETAWRLQMSNGGTMSHTARRAVSV